MENIKADLLEQSTIMQAISKRMNYFDDLLGSARTLLEESAGILNLTKNFK
jgi:hypothetical protein